jgi:hypothetical protein
MQKDIKILLILLITTFLIVGLFLFSYYKSNNHAPKTSTKENGEGISCGGDWSYKVKCPKGMYCKPLNKGPLAGGICTLIGN